MASGICHPMLHLTVRDAAVNYASQVQPWGVGVVPVVIWTIDSWRGVGVSLRSRLLGCLQASAEKTDAAFDAHDEDKNDKLFRSVRFSPHLPLRMYTCVTIICTACRAALHRSEYTRALERLRSEVF